jgi:hypothetical protein
MNTYRKKRLLSITYSAFVFLCLLVAESTFTPKLIYAAPLHLAWNANTEEDLSGYRVYYGRVSGHYELYVDDICWTILGFSKTLSTILL